MRKRRTDQTKILEPGIYADIPMEDYISDAICAEPGLSKGVGHEMLYRSPLHAKAKHPRWGGESKPAAIADMGTAIHAAVFGGYPIKYLPFKDYRSGDAQQARKQAYAEKRTPILEKEQERVEAASKKAIRLLKGLEKKHGRGEPEMTMVWQDRSVWCRSRPDWISKDRKVVIDLKTCKNADPQVWEKRSLRNSAYDLGAAHVLRGLEVLCGEEFREFIFLVQETEEPYDCSLVSIDIEWLAFAQQKQQDAVRIWEQCLFTDKWPGYSDKIYYAELPNFAKFDYETRYVGASK